MARCCVLLAEGFEEIEAITVIDVLRRADLEVVTLGVHTAAVRGAHDIVVNADALLAERVEESWDLVVLPGGMPGSATLRDHPDVQRLVRRQHDSERRVAAICAAPIALHSAGILQGRAATSFPAFDSALSRQLRRGGVVAATPDARRGQGPRLRSGGPRRLATTKLTQRWNCRDREADEAPG